MAEPPTGALRVSALRRTAVGGLVVGMAVLASGCHSSHDPQPTDTLETRAVASPTEEPVPTWTPSPEEVAGTDAMAAYENYLAVFDEVAQDHYHGWDAKMRPLVGGTQLDWVVQYFAESETAGNHQEGQRQVKSLTATNYYPDLNGQGMDQVVLKGCVDTSGTRLFDAAGNVITDAGEGSWTVEVWMLHSSDRWVVSESHTDRGVPC